MAINEIDKPIYIEWVNEIKYKILSAQQKAAISVNRELLKLYWEIGKSISLKINKSKWGSSVVEELAKDLKREFPNHKGFSRSNIFSMKKWYEFYAASHLQIEKVQQLAGQIPWSHNVAIISKSNSQEEALYYCSKTLENNWSRAVLMHQTESGLFNRQGKAITNFNDTLPINQSELANKTLKDPYKFDFLNLQEKALEKDIE